MTDGSTGVTTSLNADDGTIEFVKDGTMILSGGGFSLAGQWEFSDDKTELLMGFSFFGATDWDTTGIQRLTSKELWTRDDDGDEYHYKAK